MSDPICDPRATRRSRFTNAAIAALAPGEVLHDDKIVGLQVRAKASVKSFHIYYRFKGAERRPKIGDAAVLSIPEARMLAQRMLVRVAAGEDPSAERGQDRAGATLADVWQRLSLEKWPTPKIDDWDDVVHCHWRNHLEPQFGKRRVASITLEDVEARHKAMRAIPRAANQVKILLNQLLTAAERWKMRPLNSNPCHLVKPYPAVKRKRFASLTELQAIGAALERRRGANDPRTAGAVAFVYCMLFSGARPSEIAWATPSMVKPLPNGCGRLFIPDGKTGERIVFLPAQAMRALSTLPADRKTLTGLKWVPRGLWKQIQTEANCPDLWFRDLRRTFATVGLSHGQGKDVIGKLIGDQESATDIYALLMEHTAMDAASAVADSMSVLLAGDAT